MRRCAFLTLADPTGYVIDDHHAYAPLAALGWQVDAVPWDRPGVAWEGYDLVVIRSPWDYTRDPAGFLAVLAEIERRSARLENALPLVRWNLDKSYLRDLAARGVATVPTVWRERLAPGELAGLFEQVASAEMVVKPVIGANAEGAFRLDARAVREQAGTVEAHYADRALMAQPFVRAVLDEGEFSLFYFNGEYSHAILKTPRSGDFRVQEEHGGVITVALPDQALRRAGRTALAAVGEAPLYLRADFVRADSGDGYWLIELELVEPALYLRMDPEAPERFARAVDARVRARVDGCGSA
jgi:glutathione synthase/RimK-type ligase-like ATP-grasp enzyme